MRAIIFAAAFVAFPAAAEVRSVNDQGFDLTRTVTIAVSPAQVYAALGQPSKWWSKDHTYSGVSKNLSLDLRAGGCFCERIPKDKATIEHARVIYAQPGKMLRLNGGLGPLQGEGVSGALTFAIKPDGKGASVTMSYVVGGYIRSGPKLIAPAVDMVLGQQLAGLKAHLEEKVPQ